MAGVKRFNLNPGAAVDHPLGHIAQEAGRVHHHIIGLVKVHRAAIQRANFRPAFNDMRHTFGGPRHVGFGRHAIHRLGSVKHQIAAHAGGQVQDHIGAAVANALGDFAVKRKVARRLAGFGVAHMAMHHGRARLGGINGRCRNLLGAARHMGGFVLRATRSGDSTGDENFAVHGQGHGNPPIQLPSSITGLQAHALRFTQVSWQKAQRSSPHRSNP